ncbi:MAG TPA: glycosyltransferase [Cyanobacteria bacterium UBA8530]|nr:glycosyltransferase [Cyanobacteria bacterium UBA8530]
MEKNAVSIIAPIYNEEAIIEELHRRLTPVLEGMMRPFEVILVNDGSRDRSLEMMLSLSQRDPRYKVINFSRNFGHQIAITAGMDYANGDAVVIIDADLQDPPEVIPRLVAKWQEGFDIVYAVREKRKGETFFKKMTASMFYRTLKRITNVDIPVDTGDFRLMSRRALEKLKTIRERHRFVRGLVSWIGFPQTGVSFVREERFAGETKYPLRKMLKFAFDGITSFSFLPLQLATYMGFLVSGFAFLGILLVVLMKIFTNATITGWSSTMAAVLFMGGVQLITIGIIGEYIGRIYDEVKQRPLYIVQDLVGLDESKLFEEEIAKK